MPKVEDLIGKSDTDYLKENGIYVFESLEDIEKKKYDNRPTKLAEYLSTSHHINTNRKPRNPTKKKK